MPENTNPIVSCVQHLAVRNILAEHDQADDGVQLPAGIYAWTVALTWPTRPIDVTRTRFAEHLIGQQHTATFVGTFAMDTPTSRAVVIDHLWRGLVSAAEPPIPNTAKVTKLTIAPAGGA